MPTFETEGKLAYMYDEPTDTWHVISGVTNTAINYAWTGTNTFDGVVKMNDVFTSQAGINNFQNSSIRDSVLTSPTNGTVCFVRQDSQGNQINQLQYYFNGNWATVGSKENLETKNSSYTLSISDVGKTLLINSTSSNTVSIPLNSSEPFSVGESVNIIQYGVGKTTITAPNGVILQSRDSHRDLNGQFAKATLLKVGSDTWVLYGDITSPPPPPSE